MAKKTSKTMMAPKDMMMTPKDMMMTPKMKNQKKK